VHLKTRKRMHNERYRPNVDLEKDGQGLGKTRPAEEIEIGTTDADFFPSGSIVASVDQRTNYILRAKSFAEQQAVLSLRHLSQIDGSNSNIAADAIGELTNALISDAPPLVQQAIQRDELAALTNLQILIQNRISIVSRGASARELNGTNALEAPTDTDDSMDGIS
jgi:hypothetical protein